MKEFLVCNLSLLMLLSSTAFAMTPKEIYKKSGAGVVLIMGSDDNKSASVGTGSIISPDGHVITNAHVVISEASKQPFKTLYVFLKPDHITGDNKVDLRQRYQLSCTNWSPKEELDLALCKIFNPPTDLTTISFADPDAVEVGDSVVAVGHPEQGGLWTLTTGTISTVIANFNRIKGKDVFQTEASVNRGNSGGPLLDDNANMVGVNTMIARKAGDGLTITDINFSLKSSVAVKWLNSIGIKIAYATQKQQDDAVLAVKPVSAPAASAPNKVASAEATTAKAPEAQAKAPEAKEPAPAKVQDAPKTTAPAEVKDKPAAAAAVPAAPATTSENKPAEAKPAAPEAKPEIVITVTVNNDKEKEKLSKKMETVPPTAKVQAKEQVRGQKLNPERAKPHYVTEKRPYTIDELVQSQIKEMEDFMDEMRGKIKKSNKPSKK